MLKKILIYILVLISTIPIFANASDNHAAKIGNNYYTSLKEAIANATEKDTIILISNISLDETLLIDKIININLNNHNITAASKVFQVQGGTLNLSGVGLIKETNPNYGAIMVIGSTNPQDNSYSILNIEKDITLEGWSGIFITHNEKKSHGVIVNFAGKINAVNDNKGSRGAGIYINGNIKEQTTAPIINILDTAQITSTGNGLYIAGYSTTNIGKSYISGEESSIGIKSGKLNINGATIICTGEDSTPTTGKNNGIKPSGTALQIESNSNYAGNIEINIKNGTFKSKNSNVIYEYIGAGTATQVKKINISSGTFLSETSKDVFSFSKPFNSIHNTFLTGGQYSSNPSQYLDPSYTTTLEDNMYNVVKSTMKEVAINNIDSNNPLPIIITIIIITLLGIIFYINKSKILNFLSK